MQDKSVNSPVNYRKTKQDTGITNPIPENTTMEAAINTFAGQLVKRKIRDIKFLKTDNYKL